MSKENLSPKMDSQARNILLMLKKKTIATDKLVRENEKLLDENSDLMAKSSDINESEELHLAKDKIKKLEADKKQIQREKDSLALKLASKKGNDKSCQTISVKTKNTFSQTDSDEKPAPALKKNFISFLKPAKGLFAKKPKKRVKFFKNGNCRGIEEPNNRQLIPGFLPPTFVQEDDMVLPDASEFSKNQALKRKASPGEKATTSKRAKKSSPGKKETKKSTVKPRNVQKEEKKSVQKDAKKNVTKQQKKAPQIQTMSTQASRSLENIQNKKDEKQSSHVRQELFPAAAITDKNSSKRVSRVTSKDKAKQSNLEAHVESPQTKIPSKEAKAESVNNFVKKTEVISRKNLMDFEKMIPLGKSQMKPQQRNERSATFELTPAAIKAIEARKAQTSGAKRPMPPPVKRLSTGDNLDPTQRKRFAPARPCPSLPPNPVSSKKTTNIEKDLEISDDEDQEENEIISPKMSRIKRNRINDDDSEDESDNAENPKEIGNNSYENTVSSRAQNLSDVLQESKNTSSEKHQENDAMDLLQIHCEETGFSDQDEDEQLDANEDVNEGTPDNGKNKELSFNEGRNKTEIDETKHEEEMTRIIRKLNQSDASNTSGSETEVGRPTLGTHYPGLFLEHMITKFKLENQDRQRKLLVKYTRAKFNDEYVKNLAHDLIKAQFGRLWKYDDSDTLASICRLLGKEGPDINARRRLIVQHVYQEVREEKEWEKVEPLSAFGPMVTGKQKRLLVLLVFLEPILPGIQSEVRDFFYQSLFGTHNQRPNMSTFKINQLGNITRFATVIARYQGKFDLSKMKCVQGGPYLLARHKPSNF